jgi:hypothetical protein
MGGNPPNSKDIYYITHDLSHVFRSLWARMHRTKNAIHHSCTGWEFNPKTSLDRSFGQEKKSSYDYTSLLANARHGHRECQSLKMKKIKNCFLWHEFKGQTYFFLNRSSKLNRSKIKLNERKQWNFVDCGIVSLGTFWNPHHLVISNEIRQMIWRYAARSRGVESGLIYFFSIPLWKLPQWCQRLYINTHTHTHTHTHTTHQGHFWIIPFLTFQFDYHQNIIL